MLCKLGKDCDAICLHNEIVYILYSNNVKLEVESDLSGIILVCFLDVTSFYTQVLRFLALTVKGYWHLGNQNPNFSTLKNMGKKHLKGQCHEKSC